MRRIELVILSLSLLVIAALSIHVVTLKHELRRARGDERMCQEVLVHTCLGERYACDYMRGE